MTENTIEKLDKFFQANELLQGTPLTEIELTQAEQELNVIFDPDYKQFLRLFGGSMLGHLPIYGLHNAEVMENKSVVQLSQSFREDNWPGVEHNYIFSVDQSGNPFTINSEGHVTSFDHDAGEFYVVADSFEALLLSHIE